MDDADPQVVGAADVGQVWSAVPPIQNARPTLEKIRELLRGILPLADGVNLRSEGVLRLRIALVGDTIDIQFDDPQPIADVHYIFRFQRKLTGIQISDEQARANIQGLPDPTFEIVS